MHNLLVMNSVPANETAIWKRLLNYVAAVKLKRIIGHHIRRRSIVTAFIVTSIFLFFRESALLSSSHKKPQVNDRRILESKVNNAFPGAVPLMAPSRAKRIEKVFTTNTGVRQLVTSSSREPIAVVLVMAAKRERAIKNHLEQLIRLRPSADFFPIVISQDGSSDTVTEVISNFVNEGKKISFIHHKKQANPSSDLNAGSKNYFHIADHYKWALDKIFLEMKYKTAIITEDDLDLADDFFSYFTALKPLLLSDKTVWCISAWNDNGAANITDRKHGEKLYRTDFFPGLGWMLTAELWKELSGSWPKMYWDDWMRRQDVRKERACIRPEVSRTSHNNDLAGKGSSGGLYKKYLASVLLPESAVDFMKVDVSYVMKKNYDRNLKKELTQCFVVSVEDFLSRNFPPSGPFIIVYRTPREYRRLGKFVGLMLDIRSGMPRTAYYGIVTFMDGFNRFYAVPEKLNVSAVDFEQPSSTFYNEDWDKMTRYLEFQETYCIPTKYTGKCDPKDPNLIAWFRQKRLSRRLQQWGEMIIN